MNLPEPLADERGPVATETGRSKSDIVKESVSAYLCEARVRWVRRHRIRRAKPTGARAEADAFRAVS